MALVEAEFREAFFRDVLLLMLTESPVRVRTFRGLPDGQLVTGIDWAGPGSLRLDATPDGSPPPANMMTARADVTVRHLSIADLEADPHAEPHGTAAVFWLRIWILGAVLEIDLRRVDIPGQAPQDIGLPLWQFSLALDAAGLVEGAVHHAGGYVTLRFSTTGTDDLTAPPANHLDQAPHDGNPFLVRLSGEVFADALAGQLAKQLSPPPQGTVVEENPHAAWGNWAPILDWQPEWGWAAVANCALRKPNACPALFGPVDLSVDVTANLSVRIVGLGPSPEHPDQPPASDPPKAVLEENLHIAGDASDWDAFRCFLGSGGIGGLLIGIASPVVGVIIAATDLIVLGEVVRGMVKSKIRDVDAVGFQHLGSDDSGNRYQRHSDLPDILQGLVRLTWSMDRSGLMVSGYRLVLPGRHVPNLQPPPGPLPGSWGGGRYNCDTGQWEPDNRYTLQPISISDKVFVLDQFLLDTKVEVFSALSLPAGQWLVNWIPAGPQQPNPQVMVSSNGTPAEGATGRVYVHTNVGLVRYDIGPVPAPQPPTPERLQAERIACAKQTVRALRAQGEPSRPALAAALIALDGLLSQAGRISEAVIAMEEAVQAYRDVAAAHPDNIDYLGSLISSLHILTARYSQAGQPGKGAGLGDEAIKAATRLEAAGANEEARKSAAFNLDAISGYLPPGEEAIRAAEKATAIYRALAGPGTG
ncbi:hypothetical protein [Actinomadura oligospora]|uniref:hypothetical protein n=1 Tax=Actinomadura oligospora TaxID=111804 RepID=UPI000479A133|nr:hypothetical protein [Actinomadura oligospora]